MDDKMNHNNSPKNKDNNADMNKKGKMHMDDMDKNMMHDHEMNMGHMDKDMMNNHEMHMDDMDQNMMNHHEMHMNMDGTSMAMNDSAMINGLERSLAYSIVLAIPILLMTSFMGMNQPFISFPGSNILVIILATILLYVGGTMFYQHATMELKMRQPGMMTLISLGLSVTYLYSVYAYFNNFILHRHPLVMDYFWEFTTLILIMLLGHIIEMKSVSKSQDATSALRNLLPDQVNLVTHGEIHQVSFNTLKKGDIISVSAGQSIPADSIVIDGKGAVNESLITGESKGISKIIGDQVIGGSICTDGSLELKINKDYRDSYLASIIKLIDDAKTAKNPVQDLANRLAGFLFYFAVLIGIIAGIFWTYKSGLSYGVSVLVTVLVIACPHALGLAIPLVTTKTNSLAAANGILVQDQIAFETAKNITQVFLDKTGTLTTGTFEVKDVKSFDKTISSLEILKISADLEAGASHPIAKSIVQHAKDKNIQPEIVKKLNIIKGYGVSGNINDDIYKLVSLKYIKENQTNIIPDNTESNGLTVSYLVKNEQVIGEISLGDEVRSTSAKLIKNLQTENIIPVMLTGDNESSAASIANKLGIKYVAELSPEDKSVLIKQAQIEGNKVMMVGDGVNDAPALEQSDIGVAIGTGTQIAISTASIVLTADRPLDIINFFRLAKSSRRKVIENLIWGAGYNIIAIPVAAGILAPFGIMLSPSVGAIVMALSTVIVAVNAMLLKYSPIE